MEEERTAPAGAVERFLAALTVETHKVIRKRDASREMNKLREIELQFQVEVKGISGSVPKFSTLSEVTIEFPYPFYYAPAQRESNLQFPHFTFGYHGTAVAMHVVVNEWLEDPESGAIIGVKVMFAATGGEGAGEGGSSFKGVVHLTFQGFSTAYEDESTGING